MKAFLLLAGTALVFGVAYYMVGSMGGADVYDMPMAEVYAKLKSMQIERSTKGPFGMMPVAVGGDGTRLITLRIDNDPFCNLKLSAVEAGKTRVAASCEIQALLADAFRDGLIETVDARLHSRPYDDTKARNGLTSAGWPADVAKHPAMAEVEGKLLNNGMKMQAEIEKARQERQTPKP